MLSLTRDTAGLKRHAEAKSRITKLKVEEAIEQLVKAKEKINFNSISNKSGVSKPYLYKNTEVRKRIEHLRKQQEGLSSPKQVKYEMTEKSKDVLLASKNKRIKELEEENKRLKQELMVLRGRIYQQ